MLPPSSSPYFRDAFAFFTSGLCCQDGLSTVRDPWLIVRLTCIFVSAVSDYYSRPVETYEIPTFEKARDCEARIVHLGLAGLWTSIPVSAQEASRTFFFVTAEMQMVSAVTFSVRACGTMHTLAISNLQIFSSRMTALRHDSRFRE